jgi:hypothetical protein
MMAMEDTRQGNECSKFQLKSLPSKRAGFMRMTLRGGRQVSVNFYAIRRKRLILSRKYLPAAFASRTVDLPLAE